jgi:hypothetical protein
MRIALNASRNSITLPNSMNAHDHNTKSTSAPDCRLSSPVRCSTARTEMTVQPLTDAERAASWLQLSRMHPGNRFRLMAGLPLLPDEPGSCS